MLRKPRRARRFERAVEAPCAFWAYVERTSALMVNQHTLISRARILADHWLIFCARVRSAHGRGNPNFHSWGCRGPSRLNFCQSVCRKKGLISQTLW